MKKDFRLGKILAVSVPIIAVIISAIIGPIIVEWYKNRCLERNQENFVPIDVAKTTNDEKLLKTIYALNFTISAPSDKQTIKSNVYSEMHGTYEGDIPNNYTLWVLARDSHNFYLMYPPVAVLHKKKSWDQKYIRLDTKGLWTLYICLANVQASGWLLERTVNNNWSGFRSIPEGIKIIESVTVERQ